MSNSSKNPTGITKVINKIEAYRANVVGQHSSEYRYASCGCNNPQPPALGVWNQNAYSFLQAPYEISDSSSHLCVHPNKFATTSRNVETV